MYDQTDTNILANTVGAYIASGAGYVILPFTITEAGHETVIKISSDGTSLTLLDEEDDLIKAISPSDVKLVSDSPVEQTEPEPEEPEVVVEMDATESTSNEWDDDWNDD